MVASGEDETGERGQPAPADAPEAQAARPKLKEQPEQLPQRSEGVDPQDLGVSATVPAAAGRAGRPNQPRDLTTTGAGTPPTAMSSSAVEGSATNSIARELGPPGTWTSFSLPVPPSGSGRFRAKYFGVLAITALVLTALMYFYLRSPTPWELQSAAIQSEAATVGGLTRQFDSGRFEGRLMVGRRFLQTFDLQRAVAGVALRYRVEPKAALVHKEVGHVVLAYEQHPLTHARVPVVLQLQDARPPARYRLCVRPSASKSSPIETLCGLTDASGEDGSGCDGAATSVILGMRGREDEVVALVWSPASGIGVGRLSTNGWDYKTVSVPSIAEPDQISDVELDSEGNLLVLAATPAEPPSRVFVVSIEKDGTSKTRYIDDLYGGINLQPRDRRGWVVLGWTNEKLPAAAEKGEEPQREPLPELPSSDVEFGGPHKAVSHKTLLDRDTWNPRLGVGVVQLREGDAESMSAVRHVPDMHMPKAAWKRGDGKLVVLGDSVAGDHRVAVAVSTGAETWQMFQTAIHPKAAVTSAHVEAGGNAVVFGWRRGATMEYGRGRFEFDPGGAGTYSFEPLAGASDLGEIWGRGQDYAVIVQSNDSGHPSLRWSSDLRVPPYYVPVTDALEAGVLELVVSRRFEFLILFLGLVLTAAAAGLALLKPPGPSEEPHDPALLRGFLAARGEMEAGLQRARVLLFAGIGFAAAGLATFYVMMEEPGAAASSWPDDIPRHLRSIFILVFIEAVAVFFLRQYGIMSSRHHACYREYLRRLDVIAMHQMHVAGNPNKLSPTGREVMSAALAAEDRLHDGTTPAQVDRPLFEIVATILKRRNEQE